MAAERGVKPDCDAVVVGGGFAGVTAARELSAAGLRTTLLEARDRLGGRTWTRQFGDDTVEMGGTWFHWNQPHVWSELTRHGIGIQEDDWSFDRAMFGSPPRPYPPDEAFAKLRALFRDFAEDGSSLLPHPHDPLLLSSELAAMDQMSMDDRLEQMQLAPADRDWLTGLLYEIAGSPLHEAGLLAVLRWLALCNWNVDNWYDTNKFRPQGGTAAVIGAMLADQRVEVRLSSPVEAVDADGDFVGIRTRDGETIRAATAVIAVPVNLWPAIHFTPSLPRSHAEAARAGMGKPHQDKVWVRVRGPIGRVFGQLPAPAPLNFFWTYRLDGDTQLIMGINANPELDVNDKAQVAETLREYVPEIEEVIDVCAHNWAADEYSRGGNTCYRPGQLTTYLGDLQRPLGRIAFATADIASGWMGYIDGAIESGIRAARNGREICERRTKTPT